MRKNVFDETVWMQKNVMNNVFQEVNQMFWKQKPVLIVSAIIIVLIPSVFLFTIVHAGSHPLSRTWFVVVGDHTVDSSAHETAVMPGDVWIDAGDTIDWKSQDQLDELAFLPPKTKKPSFAFAPSAGGAHYDGKSYYNSGLMGFMPHMNGMSFIREYRLTFDVPGTFTYYNLPYEASAVVHVQAAGSSYPHSQQFYDSQVEAMHTHMIAVGKTLAVKALLLSQKATSPLVIAGMDQGSITLMRFYPEQIKIRVGEVLTFTNDAIEPHTVSFGIPPQSLQQGLQAYGHPNGYDGSSPLSSGIIGANPRGIPGPRSFSMTFSKPGVYTYYCLPHISMGMVGTVIVVH